MSENMNKRELNMDEMDQVSGGANKIIYHIGQCYNTDDIYSFVYGYIAGIEQGFGKDVAADILAQQFSPSDVNQYYRNRQSTLNTLFNFLCQQFESGWGY